MALQVWALWVSLSLSLLQGLAASQVCRRGFCNGKMGEEICSHQEALWQFSEECANISTSFSEFSSTPLKKEKAILSLHWSPYNFHLHLLPMLIQILLSLFSVLIPFYFNLLLCSCSLTCSSKQTCPLFAWSQSQKQRKMGEAGLLLNPLSCCRGLMSEVLIFMFFWSE